jgi:NAD(P)-dependent dehydrogenase (short-subunit alcohol dehydrogenase family)
VGRFEGKSILVTGANSGIGAATARRFAAEGARLVLTGLNGAEGDQVVAEINAAGGSAKFIAGDLTDRAFCGALFDQTLTRLGRLDVLVNDAGVSRRGLAEETSDEHWDWIMAVNLNAMFFLCRSAIPVMKRQGGGAIINIASELAIVAAQRAVAYCASKAAVVQMSRALALDHGRDGIRVNAICPGPIDTAMLRGNKSAEALEAIAAGTALGRNGDPDEIAGPILFLASDDASYVTGANLVADGGISID